jgi:ADP-heptose:LPS heptosyltransferase
MERIDGANGHAAPRHILIKHVGNMGDHLFLVGPLLEVLTRRYPEAEITLVTAWGYKNQRGRWGERNQDGYCIALMMENPHIDHLVHWHDSKRSLEGELCIEENKHFPTWDPAYYASQKASYDRVLELDFGLAISDNPLERVYAEAGLPGETYGNYPFYGSAADWEVGRAVAELFPQPRLVLLEGLDGQTMRGWDAAKVRQLTERLEVELGLQPIWFGAKYQKQHHGQPLTLRQNIAFAGSCDLAVGVMSGPMHFAAAAGVPTICLYGGQPLHRAAPSFFLNPHIPDARNHHVTIEGPTCDEPCLLKREIACKNLVGAERRTAGFRSWREPGRQHDKSCVATIPVDTVFATIVTTLRNRGLIKMKQ